MFASDNAAPAHPRILEAIAEANRGTAASYGADALTRAVEARFAEIFERPCAVLLVPTGTVANGLALAALTPPWGAVICHRSAHIAQDEAGAPEFFTGGAKLLTIDGPGAKLTPEGVTAEAAKWSRAWVHGAQPFALSITQATENGLSYRQEEIAALAEAGPGLALHMDGARFANAVAFTGASPAALTWRAGVSMLSFGATKNGAIAAEAIICFDERAAGALPHLRKRAGALLSKHRFIAAQMAAYLADDLWLTLAAHANAMAASLAGALVRSGAALLHPVEANEVFVRLTPARSAALTAAGALHYPWAEDGPDAFRFVTSWATEAAEIAAAAGALDG